MAENFDFETAFAVVKDDLTPAQQKALKESQQDITDAGSFNAVKNLIKRTVVENSSQNAESRVEQDEKSNAGITPPQQQQANQPQPQNTGNSQGGTVLGDVGNGGLNFDNTLDPSKTSTPSPTAKDPTQAENVPPIPSTPELTPEELKQKLINDRLQKFEADKGEIGRFDPEVAKKMLTENVVTETKDVMVPQYKEGKLTGYITKKEETTISPEKALQNSSAKDLAQLQQSVAYARFMTENGLEKDPEKAKLYADIAKKGNIVDSAVVKKMEDLASGYRPADEDNSMKYYRAMHENAPEADKKDFGRTFRKAGRIMAPYKGKLQNAQGKLAERISKETQNTWAGRKRIKYLSPLRKWYKNKVTRPIRRWWNKDNGLVRAGHKIANAPTRVKRFANRVGNAIADKAKQFGNWFMNKTLVGKGLKKIGNGAKAVGRGIKTGYNWVKNNPKKCLAAGFVVASTGIGFAMGGPAGAVAGFKTSGMIVAGATAVYGTYKLGKRAVQGVKEINNDLKSQTQEKQIERAKDLDYMQAREAFNNRPEEERKAIEAAFKNYKEGQQERSAKDDETAARQMQQALTNPKEQGGLGLQKEDAAAVMQYFALRSGDEKMKASFEAAKNPVKEDTINQPVSKDESKGKEETVQTMVDTNEKEETLTIPTQEKKGRTKVSEDVLLQQLAQMDKNNQLEAAKKDGSKSRVATYQKAKREYLASKNSKGDSNKDTQGLLGNLGKELQKIKKENPELAGAFADTLERTGTVKKGSFDKVLGRKADKTKAKGTKTYANQNNAKFNQNTGSEM